MSVHNADVAEVFNRLADLLEIEGANPFRVRAYRRAAATVAELPASVSQMPGEDLDELPGIGEDLAGKIREVCDTGTLGVLEEVQTRTPASLAALGAIPGLGPKRIHLLHERLGITTLDQLAEAAAAGKLQELPRFSAALEGKLLAEARRLAQAPARHQLATAEAFAEALSAWIRKAPGLRQAVVAGSYRRRRETIGDLDILACADDPDAVIAHFTRYDRVEKIVSKGVARSTVVLRNGLQVDLRMIAEESFGAALLYFTGSKAHNIAVRKLGQDRGLKLSEYGLFRGLERIAGRTEEEVYRALDLDYVEPELREDRGEIEAAAEGRLPDLVTLADIRGDLHARTGASDDGDSLQQMAQAAKAIGYDYLAISDPAGRADAQRLSAQLDEIERLDDRLDGIRLLKSAEVDILADGRLDLPDSALKRLDVVTCAVRSPLGLDRKAQTERIIRAMDNRHCHIIAHPMGRRIGEPDAYAVDVDRLIEAAKSRGCFLQCNAQPSRLDLDDVHCRAAKAAGVKVAIGSEARSAAGLDALRYGLDQARRGWLEREDVLNARAWPALKKLLAR
jgi:DNA polymerase (family 10)